MVIRKFFLHVSRKEQKKRFLERLDEPEKNWKFSAADVAERAHWKDYMAAYEDMIRETATPEAPWYVVPADNKWFTRLVVAAARGGLPRLARPGLPEGRAGGPGGAGRGQEGPAGGVAPGPAGGRAP